MTVYFLNIELKEATAITSVDVNEFIWDFLQVVFVLIDFSLYKESTWRSHILLIEVAGSGTVTAHRRLQAELVSEDLCYLLVPWISGTLVTLTPGQSVEWPTVTWPSQMFHPTYLINIVQKEQLLFCWDTKCNLKLFNKLMLGDFFFARLTCLYVCFVLKSRKIKLCRSILKSSSALFTCLHLKLITLPSPW